MEKCLTIKVKPILEGNILYLKGCGESLCNNEKVSLIICDCLPCDTDGNITVMVMDGNIPLYLRDEGGHNIYADQIYPRMVLRCTVATDTNTLAVHNKYVGCGGCEKYPLKHTCHPFPIIKYVEE